jgi:Zn-dependent protease
MTIELFPALGVALAFVVGLVVHEFVTHLVAANMGDPSPKFQRRLTFDLRQHADPLGTYVAPLLFIVVTLLGSSPAFYFAYGKPHAVQGAYQRGPMLRVVLTALSGPIAMLALSSICFRLSGPSDIGLLFTYAGIVLVSMVAVELLPMPGRDGGRILARLLSPQVALKYEELRQYEALFVIGVYLLFPGAVRNLASGLADLVA